MYLDKRVWAKKGQDIKIKSLRLYVSICDLSIIEHLDAHVVYKAWVKHENDINQECAVYYDFKNQRPQFILKLRLKSVGKWNHETIPDG